MAFVLPRPRADAPVRPLALRLMAALPLLLTAAGVACVLEDYVSGEIRITAHVRNLASWPLYEFLALCYASVLPLARIVAGVLRLAGLLPRTTGLRLLVGALLLLVPFALLAWKFTPSATAGGWMFVVFAGLALARLLSYGTQGASVEAGFTALWACVKGGLLRYGLATLAFLLSAFLILPLEPIFGFEMPSVEHGQYYVMLGIGVVYFLLNAAVELFPVERWLDRMHRRLAESGSAGGVPRAAGSDV